MMPLDSRASGAIGVDPTVRVANGDTHATRTR